MRKHNDSCIIIINTHINLVCTPKISNDDDDAADRFTWMQLDRQTRGVGMEGVGGWIKYSGGWPMVNGSLSLSLSLVCHACDTENRINQLAHKFSFYINFGIERNATHEKYGSKLQDGFQHDLFILF